MQFFFVILKFAVLHKLNLKHLNDYQIFEIEQVITHRQHTHPGWSVELCLALPVPTANGLQVGQHAPLARLQVDGVAPSLCGDWNLERGWGRAAAGCKQAVEEGCDDGPRWCPT